MVVRRNSRRMGCRINMSGRTSAAQKVADRNRSTLSGVIETFCEPCGGEADDTGILRL